MGLSTIAKERGSVLEYTRSRSVIVSCADDETALTALPPCDQAIAVRIAGDETWLVGPASHADAILAHAQRHLDRPGSYGVVMNVTDAWSVLTVSGSDVTRVWERLSENPLPVERPGFTQGAVAFVGAKAMVFTDRIVFFTPAPQGHHLEHRIRTGCADLSPQLTDDRDLAIEAAIERKAGTR
jgi:hypothetical protein